MSIFNKAKRKIGITAKGELLSKEAEYKLYAKVARDVEEGAKDLGVWAAAFTKVDGDEQKTKAKYIDLMVGKLKIELEAGMELTEVLAGEEEKSRIRIAREEAERRRAELIDLRKWAAEEAIQIYKNINTGIWFIKEGGQTENIGDEYALASYLAALKIKKSKDIKGFMLATEYASYHKLSINRVIGDLVSGKLKGKAFSQKWYVEIIIDE